MTSIGDILRSKEGANQENENDFGRNVLANLLSDIVGIKKLRR